MTATADIKEVVDLLFTTFGMKLPETHYGDVQSFVRQRMAERESGLDEYISSLSRDKEEYRLFINAVTIGESYFFREARHFTFLLKNLLPDLFQQKKHIKIWSAASSTGEEPYSLAALCENISSRFPGSGYTIYASDINSTALEKIGSGNYSRSSFREDGCLYHPLLQKYAGKNGNTWHISDQLRKHIRVSEHNLYSDDYSTFPEDMDIVFLRNVLIYMPLENRTAIVGKIASRIREQGTLFLSSGEVPLIWHPTLQVTSYEGFYYFRRQTDVTGIPVPEVPAAVSTGKTSDDKSKNSRPIHTDRREENDLFDMQILYENINYRLYNPLHMETGSPENGAASDVVHIIEQLNRNRWREAEKKLEKLESAIGPSALICHYRGVIYKAEDAAPESEKQFRRALSLDSMFWPSRYELAQLLARKQPEAGRREFTICKNEIQHYIDRGKYTYHFLLDGFNALYFLKICTFWEQKLGKASVRPEDS